MRGPAAVFPLCLLCVLLQPATAPTPSSRGTRSLESRSPESRGLERRALGLRTALSPERQGLRPGGAGLPPALLERPDRLQDPQPGDLNATLLRAKLGRHFDPRIMSIVRPQRRQHPHRYNLLDENLLDDDQVELDEDFPFRRNQRGRVVPVGEMPESIAALDFRGVRLPDGQRLRTRISQRLRRKLQNFLWAYTACPVTRRWRDLGLRFWPRWLKEGHCPESPCSIPPGMRCQPAGLRHQALLRWHCRPAGLALASAGLQQGQGLGQGLGEQRHCSWIKVEYPIINECACSCADDRYS